MKVSEENDCTNCLHGGEARIIGTPCEPCIVAASVEGIKYKGWTESPLVSDCCGASPDGIEGCEETGICPACREHCEFVRL